MKDKVKKTTPKTTPKPTSKSIGGGGIKDPKK